MSLERLLEILDAYRRALLADPANRAVYDRQYAEFPRLYRSQRRMFHRLNARRA